MYFIESFVVDIFKYFSFFESNNSLLPSYFLLSRLSSCFLLPSIAFICFSPRYSIIFVCFSKVSPKREYAHLAYSIICL